VSGIIGKIVQYAPLIVIIALGASMIEAFLFLPSRITEVQKRKKNFKEKNFLIAPIREKYSNSLKWVLDRKYWTMLAVGLFFIGSILMAGKAIRFVFIPEDIGEAFYIETEAAPGITLEQNQKYLKEIEKKIYTYPKDTIKHVVTSIGAAGLNNRDDVLKTGKNIGQIIVYLHPGDMRSKNQNELMTEINQFLLKQPHFKKVSVASEENGPPTGKPIYLQFRGPDFKVMDQKARPIYEYLKTIPGTKELDYSYESQNQEIHLKINQVQAARFGLTNQQIGAEIRAAFDGFIAATMKVGNETVDIRVKLKTGDVQNLDLILDNVKVDNNRGGLIPLRQLVTVGETAGPSRISHEDTIRIVSIMGGIDIKKTSAAEVLKKVNQKFGDPFKGMPEYQMIIKGELQDTNESMASLGVAFLVAMVANTFLLIGYFNSVLLPFIILATIPLSFIGIIVVFFLHGQPLSFPAIMGIVGLSGVVVNNGIVLVTFIEQLKAEGRTAIEAAIEGSVTRLRPIILTSFTTVLGLIPTAYGIGGYDPFVKPLALAMAAGLAFATLTTLFVIPSLYMIYQEEEQIKKKFYSIFGGIFGGILERFKIARG
jgi:multidrug efflux pump subunit AcrB